MWKFFQKMWKHSPFRIISSAQKNMVIWKRNQSLLGRASPCYWSVGMRVWNRLGFLHMPVWILKWMWDNSYKIQSSVASREMLGSEIWTSTWIWPQESPHWNMSYQAPTKKYIQKKNVYIGACGISRLTKWWICAILYQFIKQVLFDYLSHWKSYPIYLLQI